MCSPVPAVLGRIISGVFLLLLCAAPLHGFAQEADDYATSFKSLRVGSDTDELLQTLYENNLRIGEMLLKETKAIVRDITIPLFGIAMVFVAYRVFRAPFETLIPEMIRMFWASLVIWAFSSLWIQKAIWNGARFSSTYMATLGYYLAMKTGQIGSENDFKSNKNPPGPAQWWASWLFGRPSEETISLADLQNPDKLMELVMDNKDPEPRFKLGVRYIAEKLFPRVRLNQHQLDEPGAYVYTE
ncbi:hypothetical protein, partial [Candidatus Methylacidithermus pantelleriae]|uniref:hypothetical protein n=1 Tax=Candidatus Methylacidithermus pantelleriae TaxID=2744239 RepID=UPI00157D3355